MGVERKIEIGTLKYSRANFDFPHKIPIPQPKIIVKTNAIITRRKVPPTLTQNKFSKIIFFKQIKVSLGEGRIREESIMMEETCHKMKIEIMASILGIFFKT